MEPDNIEKYYLVHVVKKQLCTIIANDRFLRTQSIYY